jgi:hypothetical protein
VNFSNSAGPSEAASRSPARTGGNGTTTGSSSDGLSGSHVP